MTTNLSGTKLKAIASDERVSVPDTLNATFQAELNAAKALTGKVFDAKYLQDMLTVHAGDGARFC